MTRSIHARINGVGIWMRFVTPLLIGILLMMGNMILGRLASLEVAISQLNGALSNHLQHDVSELRERLARIEERLPARKAP